MACGPGGSDERLSWIREGRRAGVADQRHIALFERRHDPGQAATLDRGYAIVQRVDGAVVRAAEAVAEDEELAVRLATGRLGVRVTARDLPSRS